MSRRVIFRDLQLAEAKDFNNLGIYSQADTDAIIADGLSPQRSFSGFDVSILPGNTSVSISPGRLYQAAMYRSDEIVEISVASLIPLVQKRLLAVTVWGNEVDTQIEQRSIAIDIDDDIGEPQAVATLRLRRANVEIIAGAESGDPQMPSVPSPSLVVAVITLGVAGIESIAVQEQNRLTSTQKNSQSIGELQAFRQLIGPTVTGLISDFASMNEQAQGRASREDLVRTMVDVARLKDLQDLPDDYAQYGATFFSSDAETDMAYSAATAKIDNGLLFPDAAKSSWPLGLFNANDPNAKKHSSGLVLPAYNDVIAVAGPKTIGDVSLSQYEVKTHTVKTHTVYRTHTYFGWGWNWSHRWYNYRLKSSAYWHYYGDYYYPYYWGYWGYAPYKYYYPYTVTIPETVTSIVTTTTSYNGILTAETFRAPRAMWFTGVNLKFANLDATGDVHAFLTETDLGQPNLSKTLSQVTVPVSSLKKSPTKTPVMFNPTLLESGKLYAIVLITQGNHRIATVHADDWRDGTYFAGSDGEYFQGDLTKDIYLEVLAAEFLRPRAEIILQTVDLVGGIQDLKIATEQIVPSGTELSYELNLAGSWSPLSKLQGLPMGVNTAPLRAVAIGSKDLMPAFYTGADRIQVSRPALALSEQSKDIILAAPAQVIRVEYVVNKWDPAEHSLSPTIREGGQVRTPSIVEPARDNDPSGESKKLSFVFNLPAPVTTFKIRTDATRSAAVAPPAITERIYVAVS